jgi:hypothetical protein
VALPKNDPATMIQSSSGKKHASRADRDPWTFRGI